MQVITRSTLSTLCAISLFVLAGACQAPQAVNPSSSPSPTISSQSPAPVQSPTPSPSTTPSLTPTPSNYPRPEPTPNIQLLTEADVLSKEEALGLRQAWSSPDGQRIIYVLERKRKVSLRQNVSVHQETFEAWMLDRPTGNKSRLNLGDSRSYYNLHIDWIDNQHFVYLDHQIQNSRLRLVRFDSVSGAQSTLAESSQFLEGSLGEGWYYFFRNPGSLEAVNLDHAQTKQWPLSGELAAKNFNVKALPGGKVLLIDNRTRQETMSCASGQPCVAGSPMPAFHVHLFDPTNGSVQKISSMQGGEFYTANLLPSADGKYLGWASHSELIVIETANATEVLKLADSELLGWISPDQMLLRRSGRLEVYDLTQNRSLNQSPLNSDEWVLGFDAVSKQVLVRKGPLGSTYSLQVQNFSKPTQPGPRVTLADANQSLAVLFYTRYERQLLEQNQQSQQGPLKLLRLKPEAQGLDLLLELPYATQPDFMFKPSEAPFWYPL